MKQVVSLFLVALLATGCADKGDEVGPRASYDGPVTEAGWDANADAYRGQDGFIVAYNCRKNPEREAAGSVWGTGTYSDDSSVCSAGVHAGVISYEDGGVVVFEILPGLDEYVASTQNGVSSAAWGSWGGSFRVVN